MKFTIDANSDLGKRVLYCLTKTKHFIIRQKGSGEFEDFEVYDTQGNFLADGCPWYISKTMFTQRLMEKHKFSRQELEEIKKVYDYIDPDQGYDSEE